MENSEKLAILGTQDKRQRQTKQNTKHSMCWIPQYTKNINKT
jgi:hypothetical protein